MTNLITSILFFSTILIANLPALGGGVVSLKPGHYEGTLINVSGGTSDKVPVNAEIISNKKNQAQINLNHLDGSPYSTVILSGDINSGSVSLEIDELEKKSTKLKKSEDGCFLGSGSFEYHICFPRDEILIDSSDRSGNSVYSLSLDSFSIEKKITLEAPRVFTLEEAISRAFGMEFNTRLEFEHVSQARHQAKQAALNLLPHLNLGTVLSISSTPTLMGIFGAIGDIAPFLLPSRWLKKKGTALTSEAEQDSLIIMRGDVGVQVEGFAYLLERDEKILNLYAATLGLTEKVHDEIKSREKLGQFPAGTADNLQTVINNIKSDTLAITLTLRQEKNYAAQSLGFINPEAVQSITSAGAADVIEKAKPLEANVLNDEVLTRSFEIRQIDFLIEAAKVTKKAMYFNWLDPSSDSSTGLGFAYGQTIAIEQSKISETMVKRQQIQQVLLQRLHGTVAEFNNALANYALANEDSVTQDRRLSRTLEFLKFGKDVSIFDLVTVFQDQLRARINRLNALESYKLSRAKLDRLTLKGYYSRLSKGG